MDRSNSLDRGAVTKDYEMSQPRKRTARNAAVFIEELDVPTSEVGSPTLQIQSNDCVCALIEMQHRNLIEVISAVTNAEPKRSEKSLGYIASACRGRLLLQIQGKSEKKRINLCNVSGPIRTLTSSGESYPFCFDSGAECTLVKQSVSQQLSGTLTNNVFGLRGIGNKTVTSTLQILSNVMIGEYTFEVILYVVPR